jgi:hypothetical protein
LRSPDWRYRRAVDLFAANRPASRTRDDARTRQLLAFLRARHAVRCGASRAREQRQFSGVAEALALHESPQGVCPLVQAHLLAATPGPQIAARLGLAEPAIGAYHDCFYDVRDRLPRPDYIIPAVILADCPSRAASGGVDTAIQLAAYLGGPAALERILVAPGARSGGSIDLLAAFADATDSLLDALQYVALLKQPSVADAVARERLEQGVRRRTADQPEQLNQYEKNVQALLSSFTYRMRSRNPEDYPAAIRPYLDSTVELRAHDAAYVLAGGILPNAAELLAAKFPPPRRPDDAGQGADAGA